MARDVSSARGSPRRQSLNDDIIDVHEKLVRDDSSGRLKRAADATSVSASARLLKELRQEAGLSLRAMAKHLDMGATTYQHYEDRYKKAYLPFDFLDVVEPVLLQNGVARERVDRLTPQLSNVSDDVTKILKAPLITWVQAGAFEHSSEADALGGFEEEVTVEYERDTVIALRVRGTSINRVAPEGSIIVADYSLQELVPEKFFLVRVNGEVTVKRFMDNPARFEPFSTEPDHPIVLPTEDLFIVGRVVRVVTNL